MTAEMPAERLTRSIEPPAIHRIARFFLHSFAVLALLVVLCASGLLIYGLGHGATTYTGVRSAGVDLGSLSASEAEQRISSRIDEIGLREIVLSSAEQEWVLPIEELGVTFDASRTADDAYRIGRSGNLWIDSRDWLTGLLTGHEVPVYYTVNDAAAAAVLERLAPELTVAPQDSRFAFAPNGDLVVQAAEAGVGIDVNQTVRSLRKQLGGLSSEPVQISLTSIDAGLTADDLNVSLEQARLLASESLALEHDGARWELSPDVLLEMLSIQNDQAGIVEVVLDAERLSRSLALLSSQVRDRGQNASVVWRDGEFGVSPSIDGAILDADASADEALRAMQAGERRVTLKTLPVPAAITDRDAAVVAAAANEMLAQPLTVSWDGGEAELPREAIAAALRFEDFPSENPKIAITVDMPALEAVVEELSSQVERAAVDADLRYIDRQVIVKRPEQAGVELDVAASASAVWKSIQSDGERVALVTREIEPQITAAMAGDIRIPDQLSTAQTSYAGSVANRKHNVELAVERANGALIPPGGVYSFVSTVGDVDLESGYRVGYGIVATSTGDVSTVPSVGGGICQVSTTVFHAAFWAGMPIVERSWHFYWIPLYGQAPSGLTGLDATVDTDYGLDFKFRNTTDNWLAVVASADGQNVRFELWGTDPNWSVEAGDPVITNVIQADQTMQYQETNQLAAGTSAFIESAQNGFTVSIHRRVLKDGHVIDDVNLRSNYVPSQNVTLVGTG